MVPLLVCFGFNRLRLTTDVVAIFLGRLPVFLTETFDEIAWVAETYGVGYFRDVHIGGFHILQGFGKTDFLHEVNGCKTGKTLQFLEEG